MAPSVVYTVHYLAQADFDSHRSVTPPPLGSLSSLHIQQLLLKRLETASNIIVQMYDSIAPKIESKA